MLPISPQDRATWSRSPMAQAIADTLDAGECADWVAADALRHAASPQPGSPRSPLPRLAYATAWAITVAVVVLGVAELVELVGSGL